MKDTNTREHTTNANDNDGGDNDDDVRLFYQAVGVTVCHLWSWLGHWPVTGHHQSF